MLRGSAIGVLALLATGCGRSARSSDAPPAPPVLTATPASANTDPVAPSTPPLDSAAAAPDASAPAAKLEALYPLRFLGPEKTLDELCAGRCKIRQKLPTLGAFKQVLIVEGDDPLDRQKTVLTTHIAFQADNGWYGTDLYKLGKGVQDVEMINPPNMGMPGFGHMNRPVNYTGSLKKTGTLEDSKTHEKLTAIEFTRSDGIPENVIVLCGAKQHEPACGILRTTPEGGVVSGYTLEDGIVEVKWANGKSERFSVFP